MTHLPKETEYRAVKYRSRTEARFAVLLDNHPEVVAFKYEPFAIRNPRTLYTYLPDFIYLTKKGQLGLLEVKPAAVTKEYLIQLHQMSFFLPKTITDFVVAVCNWFDSREPLFHDVYLQGDPYNHFLNRYDSALEEAQHYRFDLMQWEGPSRKQSDQAIKLIDTCVKGSGLVNLERIIKKWLEQQ